MGAASSKNVARAVTNVSNYVSNSTEADSSQVTNVMNSTTWNDCTVYGDVDVENISTIVVSNEQIASGIQSTDLQNNISQEMMQQAQSTVGSMGIGYASASNSASVFANATSTVTNSVKASSAQSANIFNDFDCNHSTFYGDVTVKNVTDANYLSTQTLKQDATTDIVNQVSQSVTQKATAKVEGLAGFLIALALCIVALGVGFGGALKGAGDAAKPMLIAGTALGLACLMAWMYVANAPPLFSEENDCCPVDLNMGGCNSPCINQEVTEKYLKTPPLKYCYSLVDTSVTASNPGCLIAMAIAKLGNPDDASSMNNNGGYNAQTYKTLKTGTVSNDDTAEKFGITPCPDLLKIPTDGTDDDPTGNVWAIPDEFLVGGTNSCSPGIMSYSQQPKGGNGSDHCDLVTGGDNTLIPFTQDGYTITVDPVGDNPHTIDDVTDPSLILAEVNSTAWLNYLSDPPKGEYAKQYSDDDTPTNRAYHARFYLATLCGITSTYTYTANSEEVSYQSPEYPSYTVIGRPKDDRSKWWQRTGDGNLEPYGTNGGPTGDPMKYAYQFSGIIWADKLSPILSSGQLSGIFGVCNDKTYQLHHAMKTWGGWTGLVIILVLFIMMGSHGKTWGKGSKGKSAKPAAKK